MEAQRHPLEGKEVTHIQSWEQWKERWEKESSTEILHSLLHFGFSVSADRKEAVERLCLYFEIANNSVVLAKKAFQMLCQNFFKNTAEQSYSPPSWVGMIVIPQVLDKVFWFFRLNSMGDILNIRILRDGDHQKKVAEDFVHDLCLFIWDCGDRGMYPGYREITEEVRTAFRKVRPDVITLLAGLGELGLLLRGDRYKGMEETCLKRLENFAFDYELWLPDANEFHGGYRKPRTIEEACLGKSQAAQVLLVLRTLLAEKKRFDKMRELKEQRQKAEKELAELEKKK